MESTNPYHIYSLKEKYLRYVGTFLVCTCVGVVGLYLSILKLNMPPSDFPVGVDVVVEDGLSQMQIAELLEVKGVVSSSLLLRVTWAHYFNDGFVLAGTYRFEKPHTLYEIAEALTEGLYLSPNVTLVFPEGFSVKDFYTLLPPEYTYDSVEDILSYEGYLFPDTYFITNDMTALDVIQKLEETMREVLDGYATQIAESGLTEDEVLILASILEREANDEQSMRMVSGILQKRLEIGMPLQVDATLDYMLNKTSAELTRDDLALNSPYNTYTRKGLPPRPIANPGKMAIEAVLNPILTEYLYYLTGTDGVFYYAETFEEHVQNKRKYLQ